jgi:hypothetical protein
MRELPRAEAYLRKLERGEADESNLRYVIGLIDETAAYMRDCECHLLADEIDEVASQVITLFQLKEDTHGSV